MLCNQVRWKPPQKVHRVIGQVRNFRYGLAVISAGKANDWQLAWALLHDMRRATIRPATPIANATVHACGRAVQWERAMSLLYSGVVGQEGSTLDVIGYGAALAACMRATAWANAVKLLLSMNNERISPNALCYSASIAACGRDYQWALALHVLMVSHQNLGRSLQLGDKKHKALGVSACAQAAAQACEISHQWEQAVAMLVWMGRVTLSPSSKLYENVISACDRGRAWKQALAVFSEARALGLESLEMQRCTLKAFSRCSIWRAALTLLESTKSAYPSLMTTALSACERASQWNRALTLLFDTHDVSALPDGTPLRCALRSLGIARHWQIALNVWNGRNAGHRVDPWALSAIAWACEVAGKWDAAMGLLSMQARERFLPATKSLPKEFRVVEFVQRHAQHGNLASVIETIDNFALDHQWLKITGGRKGQVIDSCIRPEDQIVELGAYIGYSALRLEHQRRSLTVPRSIAEKGLARISAVEAHPYMAMVARSIVAFAGASTNILVRIGRAVDWLRSPSVLGPIDVLILDHRGTSYHEDLMVAESSLEHGARVIADNALHPGAPLLLKYVAGRYQVIVHSVHEFGHVNLHDWVIEMKPIQRSYGGPTLPDPYSDPELRRWAAEVDRMCRQSQEGPVDWVGFQKRMRPALERFIRHGGRVA